MNSERQDCNSFGINANCGPNSCSDCLHGYEGKDCGQCQQGFYVASGTNGFVNSTTREGPQCIGKFPSS